MVQYFLHACLIYGDYLGLIKLLVNKGYMCKCIFSIVKRGLETIEQKNSKFLWYFLFIGLFIILKIHKLVDYRSLKILLNRNMVRQMTMWPDFDTRIENQLIH